MRTSKDTSWTATFFSVVAIFAIVTIAFGFPTGGGGPTGDALILAGYAGQALAVITIGAIGAGVSWFAHRMRSAPYATPRRDLMVIAFVALCLSLFGSGRLDRTELTTVIITVGFACALLIYGKNISAPKHSTLVLTFLGVIAVSVPIVLIAGSIFVLERSAVGAVVMFVAGAALLLFLLLRRRSQSDQSDA